MKRKNVKIIVAILIAVLFVSVTATYAWFSIGLTGNGNEVKASQTAISLGTIKYDGVTAFQSDGMYPGEIGITSFTVEKGEQEGFGKYEIDLESVVDVEFGSDIEISLYKSTSTSDYVEVEEGSLITSGDISKVDELKVVGHPELVYGLSVLTTDSETALETISFDTATLEKTTYYLVYHYKNNENEPQNDQMGHEFSGKVTIKLLVGEEVGVEDLLLSVVVDGRRQSTFPEEHSGYLFERVECKNSSTAEWNRAEWDLMIHYKGEDQCTVYFKSMENRYGAGEIALLLDEYKEGNIYTNPVTMANDDLDGNIRYIGSDPNNYVNFNGETWRIIGVFPTIGEDSREELRIKMIRNESLGNIVWSAPVSGVNSRYGVNQWGESTDSNGNYAGATLMQTLNDDYLNRTGSYAINGLTEESRGLIESVVWNTGTIDGTTVTISNAKASDWYQGERSNNNGKMCTSGDACNDTVVRTTVWSGYVGLMYPSDYGYSTGGGSGTYNRAWCLTGSLNSWQSTSESTPYKTNCAEKSWLLSTSIQWTLTPLPFSASTSRVVYVNAAGGMGNFHASYSYGTSPVVYLNSKAVIKDGDGTQGSPYVFELAN